MIKKECKSILELDLNNEILFSNKYKYETDKELVEISFLSIFEKNDSYNELEIKIFPKKGEIDVFQFTEYRDNLLKDIKESFFDNVLFQKIYVQINANNFETSFRDNGVKLSTKSNFFKMDIKTPKSLLILNYFNVINNINIQEDLFDAFDDYTLKHLKLLLKELECVPSETFLDRSYFNDFLKLNMSI